jgi:gamma-glutamyltranspeptidase/glutathione hydrolase
MRNGGNAIDAAVATAAMLNPVEPRSTGVAADMFAVIYVAKEKKVYTLNSSVLAPNRRILSASLCSCFSISVVNGSG